MYTNFKKRPLRAKFLPKISFKLRVYCKYEVCFIIKVNYILL